jgi:hypothetical protein
MTRKICFALGVRFAAASLLGACTSEPPDSSFGAEPSLDGPGRYYVFKTFDTAAPLTEEQQAACMAYFGAARYATLISKLNAALFSFTINLDSGRSTDQTAAYLGPGLICIGAGADASGTEAFATTALPGVGTAAANGPCALSPIAALPGVLFANCNLQLQPDALQGLLGGMASSNSVSNNAGLSDDVPKTGSIWTAYVVRKPGAPTPPDALPGTIPVVPDSNLDFYLYRAFDETRIADAEACHLPGVTQVFGARRVELSAVQPVLHNGALDSAPVLDRDADLTLCFTGPTGSGIRDAVAHMHLSRGGQRVELTSRGSCRDFSTPAGTDYLHQTCRLDVDTTTIAGFVAGQLTLSGLVAASEPLRAANSNVWTLSVVADPAND